MTPMGSRPASRPASSPSCGRPFAAKAPASTQPSVSATARTSVRPILPAAPTTTIRISAMTDPYFTISVKRSTANAATAWPNHGTVRIKAEATTRTSVVWSNGHSGAAAIRVS